MSYSDPEAAEAAFYTAFQELDLELMRAVWLDSERTSCIHPGGALLQGTAAILASWAEIFHQSAPPQIIHRLVQASSDRQLAVHTVEEQVQSGAGQRRALVLATNIYGHVEGKGWFMLAHHASLPLVETPATDRSTAYH